MKLAIMQPYFFPYPGYFSLIKNADKWIFNDEVQMIHKGWVQRNRILKQYGGWHYIQLPLVKHPYSTLIKDVRVRTNENWQGKILAQFGHYKKRAPYYYKVISFLNEVFKKKFDSLTQQNAYLLQKTSAYIGFEMKYEILSEMDIDFKYINAPDDWSLNICKALGYDSYVNPILGKSFYNRDKYEKNGVHLSFLRLDEHEYKQFNDDFIGGLSILDLMMFNSPEEINNILDDFKLE